MYKFWINKMRAWAHVRHGAIVCLTGNICGKSIRERLEDHRVMVDWVYDFLSNK